MSLLVTAAIVGGGALVAAIGARIAVGRRRRARAAARAAAAAASATTAPRSRLADSGFTVEQGDVVSITGRELWLEQGWLLLEANDAIAALLFAREAALLVHPKPRPRFYWLSEIELRLPADPPSALDHGGVRYERARRLPVTIEPLPKSPDPPWQTALLTEYRGLGNEVLWALLHAGSCRAWSGRAVDDAEVELWGAGSSSLDP